MGIEDIFDGPIEPVVEAPQEPVAEPIEPPVVAAEPEPAEPPVIEEPKEDKSVPLPTFLDMRDAKKAAERERDEARAALAAKDPPSAAPDPYDDPQGFAAHNAQQVQQAVLANKFEMSDVMAKQTHGAETVDAATAWAMDRAKENPAFAAQYMREAHPIDWIVRQHKEAADLDEYRKDPVAFARKLLETHGQAAAPMVPAPVVTAQQQAPVTPPRSLASTPSVDGGVKDIPTGPLAALEAVFTR